MARSDMIALDDLPQLKRRVEELERQRERAKGRYDEIRSRLRQRFGCKTLAQAKKLLKKKQDARLAAYREYTAVKERFEKRWADKLGGDGD